MKKICIILLFTALSIIAGLIFFRPMPIIPDRDNTVVNRVWYNWEDATNRIDFEEVADILSRYYTRRTFHNPFPNLMEDVVWDMTVFRGPRGGRDLIFISLGKDSVVHAGASDIVMHRVIDPESLMYELSAAME